MAGVEASGRQKRCSRQTETLPENHYLHHRLLTRALVWTHTWHWK
ncbi:MAG: hypothetical protein QOJ51_5796 [Acidobacteriaceae bacterium]|jgi:hypothetical protein|nr:hypothetical protein [Acidobacteriaceae bacterium]MEA2262971.1 hypothetical protein [Acidobacteriaceae bacterium]